MTTHMPSSAADGEVLYQQLRRETAAARWAATTPPDHLRASATVPAVVAWVQELATAAQTAPEGHLTTGPSLVLLGAPRSARTTEAWGAVKAIADTGAITSWEVIATPELYAALLPQPGPALEFEPVAGFDVRYDVFETYLRTPLLVLDDFDLTASPRDNPDQRSFPDTWRRTIIDRLVNARYEHILPTVVVSSLPLHQPTETAVPSPRGASKPRSLTALHGERVTSRLHQMARGQHIVNLGDGPSGDPAPTGDQPAPATPAQEHE